MTDLERFLYGLRARGVRPGLEATAAVLAALGHPDRRQPVLQIAGTVGKGSTAAFATAILRATGRRVGQFVSPHLVRFTERFVVDGVEASHDELSEAAEAVRAVAPWAADPLIPPPDPGLRPLTFFEWCVVLACEHFARAEVDVAVLEVGLGGRWDATTAAVAETVAVTRIDLDHTAILGPDLPSIAREKAGAFRPGVPAVVGAQAPEAAEALLLRAAAVGAPLKQAGEAFTWRFESGRLDLESGDLKLRGIRLGLAGAHQAENAALAVTAVQTLLAQEGDTLTPEAAARGLAAARWPGRLEQVAEDLWVDGAHNPAGARALAEALPTHVGPRVHLVFAVLEGRTPEPLLEALLPRAASVTLTRVGGDRAVAPDRYADWARARHPDVTVEEAPDRAVAGARARAAADGLPVVAAGSLYLVGAVKAGLILGAVDPGEPPLQPVA